MSQEALKWPTRFMELAEHIATWSQDPSTKTGAVIIGREHEDKKVLGMGFNGFPRGVKDHAHRYQDRPTKYSLIVHCEANAILDARTHSLVGACLISTKFPCSACAKLIIQAGIAMVITRPQAGGESDERWRVDAGIARKMFQEADVTVLSLCRINGLLASDIEPTSI